MPSLHEACHEEPYATAQPGFGQWPRTKWWWASALAERPGVHILEIHRGKNLIVTAEVAALADPVCRAELERMAREDRGWSRLLAHLAEAGPSTLEDAQVELGLKPRELKALRVPLERCGAVVSRQLVAAREGGGELRATELERWDQVFPERSERGELRELVVAAIRACVVAREDEVPRWFSWVWLWRDELLDELVEERRLCRPAPGWLALA